MKNRPESLWNRREASSLTAHTPDRQRRGLGGKIVGGKILAACLLAFLPPLCQAQAPALPPQDAGRILREAETLRPPEAPRQEVPPLPAGPAEAEAQAEQSAAAEETLYLRAFHIEQPEPLTAEEVAAVLAPYTGRKLSMAEIDAAVRTVSAYYQARGFYLAQAILPAQDARDGTLRIAIAIGRIGAVRLHHQAPVRAALLHDIFGPIGTGAVAQRAPLERALLTVAELPGARLPSLDARPGAQPGSTDLDITIPAGARFNGFALYDNQGSRYTGRHRLAAGMDWNSPLGLGDKLSLSGIYGRGSARHTGGGRLAYALPVSAHTFVDASLDRTEYALGDQYEALEATGTAQSVELGARHVALHSQRRRLEFDLRFASRRLADEIGLLGEQTRKDLTRGALSVRYEHWGQLLQRTLRVVTRLEYARGRLHFKDAAQRAANRLGADTQGRYRKLELSGAFDWAVSSKLKLNLEWSVQRALGKSLDGNEQLSITGARGVRAYRESISADHAYVLHMEARYALPPRAGMTHSLGVFADRGRGWFERPAYVLQNGVTATDAGLVYAASRAPFFARAQVAHKLGSRPDERLARDDGDTHFLLQVGAVF
jgi:hemolysin activation/secretion protein